MQAQICRNPWLLPPTPILQQPLEQPFQVSIATHMFQLRKLELMVEVGYQRPQAKKEATSNGLCGRWKSHSAPHGLPPLGSCFT